MAAKINIKKLVSATFWSVAGAGVLVLLIAAIRYRNSNVCKGFRIEIAGPAASNALFIDRKGIADILTAAGAAKGQNKPIRSFDLRRLEATLGKNVWIKNAELFFDHNGILQVRVIEREPVARVFVKDGSSCYIDSGGIQLPLPDRLPMRLPVFTGYPAQKIMLHGSDSTLTRDLLHLSDFIRRDSFWSAQIAQVAIVPGNAFELEPETGSHRIVFGDGSDIEGKFHRLSLFYQDVLSRAGLDRYSRVDISYAGQIIAERKGTEHGHYDSTQGMINIRQMIRSAQQLQPDTLRQQNVRPLEHPTNPDQAIGGFDLVSDATDSISTKPSTKPNKKQLKHK